MTDDLTLEGTGNWSKIRHRTRPDIREVQVGFNVVQDVKRQDGTYRPARNLPVQYTRGNWVDAEGIVWSQGKILGMYDPRIFDTGANAYRFSDNINRFGIADRTTGKFFAYNDVRTGSGVQVEFADGVWGYSEDIKGLLVPMNGYGTDVQDKYGTDDENFALINPVTGDPIVDGDNATLRAKGDPDNSTLELVGVAHRDTMRETRSSFYQYQRDIEAIGVAKVGYIYVPFAVKNADVTLDGVAAPVYSTSQQRKISKDQTVLFVEKRELLQHGAVIFVDAWGNPLLPDPLGMGAEDKYELEFGTLVDFNFAIDIPYADYVQTYPFVEVAGTGTIGIDHAVFFLGRKIKGMNFPARALHDYLKADGLYGWAKIRFDIP